MNYEAGIPPKQMNTPEIKAKKMASQNEMRARKKAAFPEKPTFVGKRKIIPAHMAVFQHYKDQGFRSLGKAIRKTGVYSDGMANNVAKFSSSKSWQTILDLYLPEEILALRHSELLNKRDTETVYDDVPTKQRDKDGKVVMKKVARLVDLGPETNAVSKGLELGYRLRGAFSKDDTPATPANVYNLFYKPEIRQQVATFEAGIKQSLFNEINKRNIREIADEKEARTGDGPEPSGK